MHNRKFRYWLYRARSVHPLPIVILFLLLAIYKLHQYPFPTYEHSIYINSIQPLSKRAAIAPEPKTPNPQLITKDLVISATTSSNLAWLSEIDQEAWTPYIYISNATSPSQVSPRGHTYLVPMNKGNEAMAYLTHIIENYDNLADITVFHHDHYTSWHQTLTSPTELNLLNSTYILQQNYVSLKCPITPDCSDLETIKLSSTLIPLRRMSRMETRAARIPSLLAEFLGKEEMKRVLGWDGDGRGRVIRAPCCAMFAVSREAILGMGREVWVGLRKWLVGTELDSWAAGRIFEWTWHIWFGMDAVLCPPPTCECDLYNIGDTCGEREGFLEEQKRLQFARQKYVSLMSHKGSRALGNQ